MNDKLTEVDVHDKVLKEDGGEWSDFTAKLPANEGRYAVYDLDIPGKDGVGPQNKIVFLVW